jgi:hypothetical protein
MGIQVHYRNRKTSSGEAKRDGGRENGGPEYVGLVCRLRVAMRLEEEERA